MGPRQPGFRRGGPPWRPSRILAAVAAILVLAVFAVPATTAVAQDRGGYSIRSFDAELTIESNAEMVVEERIVVEFTEPRHGIYRTIPVRYSDPKGYAYSLGLRIVGVTDDDGRPYPTETSNEGRYVNIRIGDPDRTVEGTVVYVVRYRVREALSRFAEHDEIYWNATGNEWNVPIARSSAIVRLPSPVPTAELTAAGYTGAFGMNERAVEVSHPEPGVVRFSSTRALGPLEGLTVAVGFPQGVVTFPSTTDRLLRSAADNWILLLPLGWFWFLFARYRSHGRDPHGDAPVMVTYEPPPGMSPGAIGAVIDERVDLVDITATVVDLAVRGYLTIRAEPRPRFFGLVSSDETVFRREPQGGSGKLAPHERSLLDALFLRGDEVGTIDLTNEFYQHIPGIRSKLYESLVADGHFDASPEKVRQKWAVRGLFAGIATGALGVLWMTWRGVPPPAVTLVPLIAGVVTAILFWAFSAAMPRRTEKGSLARQWALGFQEFARRVEGDRLAESAAESDLRHDFEVLLPYAMALGVANEWARKFEGIYDRSGPAWYVGYDASHGFSTQAFQQNLSSAMAKTGTSMTSSPRSSSGSGGGGSSGGGGGGGGGGSW